MDIIVLLQQAVSNHASDIFVVAGLPVSYRANGRICREKEEKLMPPQTKECVEELYKLAGGRDIRVLEEKGDDDFSFAIPGLSRFRVSAYKQRGALSAVIRVITFELPEPNEIGIPDPVMSFYNLSKGLVLVTGPAGSGKSTTLACLVDKINHSMEKHIITLEDPIEYYHKTVNSLITQREVGTDTQSFNDAINMAMRQDPDVLVISDIKDADTLMAATTAAEKGFLVIAAMNMPDTVQAVRRMLSTFTGETQRQFRLLLASCLRGVISQKLITRADDKGRVPAVEVLVVDMAVSDSILNDNLEGLAAYLQQGSVEGMQSFNQSMSALYSRGLIAKDEEQYHEEQQPVQDFSGVDAEIHLQEQPSTEMNDNDTIMNWL